MVNPEQLPMTRPQRVIAGRYVTTVRNSRDLNAFIHPQRTTSDCNKPQQVPGLHRRSNGSAVLFNHFKLGRRLRQEGRSFTVGL
jgi:hypothetical protein